MNCKNILNFIIHSLCSILKIFTCDSNSWSFEFPGLGAFYLFLLPGSIYWLWPCNLTTWRWEKSLAQFEFQGGASGCCSLMLHWSVSLLHPEVYSKKNISFGFPFILYLLFLVTTMEPSPVLVQITRCIFLVNIFRIMQWTYSSQHLFAMWRHGHLLPGSCWHCGTSALGTPWLRSSAINNRNCCSL